MIATEQEIFDARSHEETLSLLLNRNRKFLLVSSFHACGRYISSSDDEYSVAMRAFHEAILTWRSDQGSFANFCRMVIQRRLLDYIRKESKYKAEINVPNETLDGQIEEDESALETEIRKKLCEEGLSVRERAMKEEIDEIQEQLKEYGFSFYDLSACSPKAQKTKNACGELIRTLAGDEEMMKRMRETKTLPISDLCRRCSIQKKIAERHRRYIIAAAEIVYGDYPLLKEYIPYCCKGE